MDRLLIINLLTLLFCSFVYASNDWNSFESHDTYPNVDKRDCVFPFTYQQTTYNDCTTDGDNGKLPWCSLTADYIGQFKYCYDFRSPAVECTFPFTLSNGKSYPACAVVSRTFPYQQCGLPNGTLINCIDKHTQRLNTPIYGRNPNCASYKSISPQHTMCFGPSEYAIPVPLNSTEKSAMLDLHNSYRGRVNAKVMYKVYYDDELAKLAQGRADLCVFDHDLAENRVSPSFGILNGQNMVMASETRTTPAMLFDQMFTAEKGRFTYGSPCAQYDSSCLHYTQLMLSGLTRIGCGQTHCLYPDRVERFVVCNYIYSQYDTEYQTPYTPSDTPASGCPKTQVGNLCDCQNKYCNHDNGEVLEPDTCTCKAGSRKRSADDKEDKVVSSMKPFVAPSTGNQNDFDLIDKRSLNMVAENGLAKRHIRKLVQGN